MTSSHAKNNDFDVTVRIMNAVSDISFGEKRLDKGISMRPDALEVSYVKYYV